MTPDVEAYAGSLWGVLTVRTYGKLNDRELAAVMEEWKAMADSGWGEELFYRPIRTGGTAWEEVRLDRCRSFKRKSFNANQKQWLNMKRTNVLKNVLRSHVCSCIIALV